MRLSLEIYSIIQYIINIENNATATGIPPEPICALRHIINSNSSTDDLDDYSAASVTYITTFPINFGQCSCLHELL